MTRKQLKDQAKAVLRQHYWKIFVLGLIVSLVSMNFVGFSTETVYSYDYTSQITYYYFELLGFKFPISPSPMVLVIMMVSAIAGLIFSIFVIPVIQYGYDNKLVHYALGNEDEFDLFDGFRKNYKNIVVTNFMASLFVFLWSFVFFIPGCIKAYQYYYINQVLYEHPDWNWKKVLAESKRMTQGHKWSIFVLELSFILWYFLAGLALGFGEYFIRPYVKLTHAFKYLEVKESHTPKVDVEIIVNENNF